MIRVIDVKPTDEIDIGEFSILIDFVDMKNEYTSIISYRAFKRNSRALSLDLRYDKLLYCDVVKMKNNECIENILIQSILLRL